MDDVTRTTMLAHLRDLRALLAASDHTLSKTQDDVLLAHIAELERLVARAEPQADDTRGAAQSLEARLLALEAEHPHLAAFASRIAHALEAAGL